MVLYVIPFRKVESYQKVLEGWGEADLTTTVATLMPSPTNRMTLGVGPRTDVAPAMPERTPAAARRTSGYLIPLGGPMS